jgi:hypothetical protein
MDWPGRAAGGRHWDDGFCQMSYCDDPQFERRTAIWASELR